MMRSVLALFVMWIPAMGTAQVTFHVTDIPANTPDEATLYISGDFEGWTGGDDAYALEEIAEGHVITIPQMTGTMQFKFTLGSWQTVEKGPNGEEIGNRTYTFGGNGDTVSVQIASWAGVTGGSTAADNVIVLDNNFYIPQLDRRRRIWVYLPPDYDEEDQNYPVLYVHDGQNCFDATTAFAGEWEMDETLNDLADAGELELIVVGIDNGGANRIDEYSPWVNPQYGGGQGEAYIDFLSETLKPHIDSTFRTLPDPVNTGILGSSLGGLISHYGALARPDIFGKSGVFSPSFWFAEDSVYSFGHMNGNIDEHRMYLLAGALEGGDVPGDTQQMIDTMAAAGFPLENAALVIDANGEHNEAFWSRKFKEAVTWLFLGTPVSTTKPSGWPAALISKVYPNPTLDTVVIEFGDQVTNYDLRLIDPTGRVVMHKKGRAEVRLNVSDLGPGLYSIEVSDGSRVSLKKLLLY
jgi:predicted alpha/beta superfamily hydrolase